MTIAKFIDGLNSLSKETGIYLRGNFHYYEDDGKLYEPAGETTYHYASRIDNYDGAGHGATGNFIVADGLEPKELSREPHAVGKAPMAIGDLQPYISATGEYIGGRRQHREYLKDNNLVEVGNEKKAFEKAVRDAQAPTRLTREDVAREFYHAENGSRH